MLVGARAAARCRGAGLPFRRRCSTFGARGGRAIANKASVLDEVDRALGVQRPPDLEVILTDHLTCIDSQLSILTHSAFLRFGHVAVRYTTSDGTQRLMNILGALDEAGTRRMVNFVAPDDYLYGTEGWDSWAQQGGAYNRDIIGVRVERCTPGATDAMHAYFTALQVRSEVGGSPTGGAARFQLVEARLSSVANQLPPLLATLLRYTLDRTRRATEVLSRPAKSTSDGDGDSTANVGVAAEAVNLCRRAVSDVRTATWTAGNWCAHGVRLWCERIHTYGVRVSIHVVCAYAYMWCAYGVCGLRVRMRRVPCWRACDLSRTHVHILAEPSYACVHALMTAMCICSPV